MNLWKCDDWSNFVDYSYEWHRSGLRLRFDKGVDKEVKRACIEFCKWLRTQYFFPKRVPIYFKSSEFIYSQAHEKVSATFLGPYDKKLEPYIRISTGDYLKMEKKWGKDNALAAILGSIAHELSHYFQWLKDINFPSAKEERQALYYKRKIIEKYAEIREHP